MISDWVVMAPILIVSPETSMMPQGVDVLQVDQVF